MLSLDFYKTMRLEGYGIDLDIAESYRERLIEHITNVQQAGVDIGVPLDQLARHDLSKWSREEFPAYAMYFAGNKNDQSPVDNPNTSDDFARAWLHHIHANPHHWQHHIFPDGFSPKGSSVENGVVKMPERYALEMISDWMGASKTYTGDWDMTDWLLSHIPSIKVHSETAVYLATKLKEIGYCEVVSTVWFDTQTKD